MRVRLGSALALFGILVAYGGPSPALAAVTPVVVTVGAAEPSYLPGTEVTVQGSVQEGGSGLAAVAVALEADGSPSGQRYWVDEVTTDGSGDFSDTFWLPSSASQDTSIQLYAVANGARDMTTFQVATPIVPVGPSGGTGGAGGTGGPLGGGGVSPTSTATCSDQPQGVVISGTMDSQGGTLISTDNCIALEIPSGAFAKSTQVTVTESAPTTVPSGDETALAPELAIDFGGASPSETITASVYYNAGAAGGEPQTRIGLFEQQGPQFQYVKSAAQSATSTLTAGIKSAGSYVVAVNKTTFNDVSESVPPGPSLDVLLGRDAVSGFPDGGFHPSAVVTRAQFVKMLVLTLGLPLPATPSSDGFNDVPAGSWYAPYVDAAVSAGLVQGITKQEFGPQQAIKRDQMAVLMYRAMNGYTPSQPTEVTFSDQAQIPAWALQDVMTVAQANIMQGVNGAFEPTSDATRAQSAEALASLVTVTGQ